MYLSRSHNATQHYNISTGSTNNKKSITPTFSFIFIFRARSRSMKNYRKSFVVRTAKFLASDDVVAFFSAFLMYSNPASLFVFILSYLSSTAFLSVCVITDTAQTSYRRSSVSDRKQRHAPKLFYFFPF